MSGGRGAASLFGMRVSQRCPACQAPAIIRTPEDITPLVRNFYFHCTNTDCGQTWVSQLSVQHAICPSQMPDPIHPIPDCPSSWVRRRPPPPGFDPDQSTIFDHLGDPDGEEDGFQPPGTTSGRPTDEPPIAA